MEPPSANAPGPSRSLVDRRLRALVIVFYAGAGAYGLMLGHVSLRLEGRFTPDSVFYIDAANNFRAGRGLSSSMVELARVAEAGTPLPKPMTVWGPLYPILIAAGGLLGASTIAAALALSVLGFTATVILTGLVCGRVFGTGAGVLAAALLLHFDPLREAALHAWSETSGLAPAAGAMLAALGARDSNRRGLVWAVAGVLAGSAAATRYALVPIIALLMILAARRRRDLGALLTGAVAVSGPFFLRNLALTGRLGGDRWGAPDAPLGQLAAETARAVWASLTAEDIALFASFAVLGAAAFGGTLLALVHRRDIAPAALRRYDWAVVFIAWPLIYLAFLVYGQSRVRIDPIDARLVLPATVFLITGGAGLLAALARLPGVVYAIGAVALLSATFYTESANVRLAARNSLPPTDVPARQVRRSEILQWAASHTTARDLLIVEDGLDWPFHLGPRNVLFFVENSPMGEPVSYEMALAYLAHPGICARHDRVFFVCKPKGAGSESHPFLDDLRRGRLGPYPNFELSEVFADGIVFSVRCGPSDTV